MYINVILFKLYEVSKGSIIIINNLSSPNFPSEQYSIGIF